MRSVKMQRFLKKKNTLLFCQSLTLEYELRPNTEVKNWRDQTRDSGFRRVTEELPFGYGKGQRKGEGCEHQVFTCDKSGLAHHTNSTTNGLS